jgi:hypothetical protein
MALPQTVRVKLSSEAAESIALTPVLLQELPIRELVEHMLGVTGKDEARIRELLLRGTLVSGASRFRWAGWESDLESIRELLATFPNPDPSIPFDPTRCTRAILRGGRKLIEIPREAGEKKSLFQKGTFWSLLMEISAAAPMSYAGYSYRDRADRFLREFTLPEAERLRAAHEIVRYTTLQEQIRTVAFTSAELFVTRG